MSSRETIDIDRQRLINRLSTLLEESRDEDSKKIIEELIEYISNNSQIELSTIVSGLLDAGIEIDKIIDLLLGIIIESVDELRPAIEKVTEEELRKYEEKTIKTVLNLALERKVSK